MAANPAPVALGTAKTFGVLAGAAISGTGNVKGDVGSASGAIAPAITSTGTIYPTGDAVATAALADAATAYSDGKNRTVDNLLSAAAYELGGKTLVPGVHKIGAAATLGSPVTLDAQGDPDAVFIIQIGAAFSATASVGNVVLANNAQGRNIFWIVEGAVSMGASIHMEGNILGNAAITFGATTVVNGRLLAGAAAGTVAMATAVNVPVDPSVVGNRVWLDANINGIQDPSETTGFSSVPVSLLQLVLEKKTLELGTAANFGALAGAAISGSGNVTGHVGSGTGAIAPAITSTGTIYATGNAAVMTALADFATAYTKGKNRTPDFLLSAAAWELGGSTLTPGVYKIGAAATLATPMTLDAQGDPEAVFIIQIVGAFGTTAATGNVVLANNAKSANVYWIVEGAVSLGAGTHMKGNILGGAAITFGVNTDISGRALAGTGAGTLALSTAVTAVTGAPPVGFPPPIVVANTVTDANGNYLFEGVQPGTLMVRWDLATVTSDYRLTTAKQGGDDAVDSDSASGAVGGFAYSPEFVVLGGSTHLDVDLGLAATLPAIKTAARDQLASTLVTYLLANYYTGENWTVLMTAKTDGDAAINAATDPAGVAAAKNTALAAMDAVPTVAETLAEAKAAAVNDLTLEQATYLEANYTAENWTTLTTARTNGGIAINAAANLAGVATARTAALAAMAVVPTVEGTLGVAKTAALNNLALVVATYLEANYTDDGWIAFQTAKVNGQIAINAATNLAGVATATNAALAALDAVPTFTETMVTARTAALSALTAALATNLETNYYTAENWTALIAARAAGNTAINAAATPIDVLAAKDAAVAAMDAVPTITESLAMAKAAALSNFLQVAATYLETNYSGPNWTALQAAITNGQAAIQAATNLAGVATATNAALATLDAVPVLNQTMATARALALNALTEAFATYLEANYYTSENWQALIAARAEGSAAINAAIDTNGVATAKDEALAAMAAVPTISWMLAVAKAAALDDFAMVVATYRIANYSEQNWTALQTAITNGRAAINAATNLADLATATNEALAALDAVPVIDPTLVTARATALNALTEAFATYLETNNYTSENLMALIAARAAGSATINVATDAAGVVAAKDAALAAMDAVLTITETLTVAKAAALSHFALAAATYLQANYSDQNWAILTTAKTNGQAAINAATNLASLATATNEALAALDAVPVSDPTLAPARAAALNDLTAAFAIHLEANNYTSQNLMALIAARAEGSATINAATNPAGVATARNAALAAMDAVPAISWMLAVAKEAALEDFAMVVATYLETNYTAQNWTALQTAITNGQAAINAATNLAGLAMATNAALATLDAVPVLNQTMATARALALNALTTAFANYLEVDSYTSENLMALIAARAAGSATINVATTPAGVVLARDEALAAMAAVPTSTETLAAAQAAALANLAALAATYQQANYTPAEWAALQLALANAQAAINAATSLAGVTTATNAALAALDAVLTISETTLAAAQAAALANLAALAATYQQANYTPEQWAAIQLALANALAAINAATNAAAVAQATSAALAALAPLPTSAQTLAAAQAAALADLAALAATYLQANYTPAQWAALQLALANALAAINAATNLADVATATNTGLAAIDAVPTIAGIVDHLPPTVNSVHIASNNIAPNYAKAGDTVTLSFTASEALQTPSILISGSAATVSQVSGNLWTATRLVTGAELPGAMSFSLTYLDLAGNAGTPVTATSDASSVILGNLGPEIISQSGVLTLDPGEQAVFSVQVTSLSPVTYQWRKGMSDISGATGATYTIAAVTEADEGTYSCIIINTEGITVSLGALIVNAPIVITANPSNTTVNQNEAAHLTVAATVAATTHYQWRRNGVVIPNSDSATLTVPLAQPSNAGYYDVILTNIYGSLTSEAGYLSVLFGAPRIARHPASRLTEPETPVTFSVTAVGTAAFDYEWRKSGKKILSAPNAPTYTIPSAVAADTGAYTVKVTNSLGSVISDVAALSVKTAAYVFSTWSGKAGVSGAGDGEGINARFFKPNYMVRDSHGNLFVTDRGNSVIRKITPSGVVTLFAGLAGSAGTADGTGTAARFMAPEGIGIDGADNLFVADATANTIRRITPGGAVTTFAGSAVAPAGGADGVGILARFSEPRGVAVGTAGVVYVADSGNHTVRKIATDGTVSTLAGLAGAPGIADGAGNVARFYRPAGLAVNTTGDIFVADELNHAIRKVTSTGVVTTVAGLKGTAGAVDATGAAARFKSPNSIAVDASGVIFVGDTGNHRLRTISLTGAVRTIGGSAAGVTEGMGSKARFRALRGLVIDDTGDLYIADTDNNTLRKGVLVPYAEITTQPLSVLAGLGQTPTFTVVAAEPSLTYQWRKGTANIPVAQPTSRSPSYTLPPLTKASIGKYNVVVTNAAGSVASANARLGVVNLAPSVVGINEAKPISLTLVAAGEGLTYEWRKDGYPMSNGGRITGVTTLKLKIASAALTDAGRYTCMVRMGLLSLESGAFDVGVRAKPVLVTFGSSSWIASGTVTDVITAVDLSPLNRPTSYAVSGLPAGMTFNKATGQLGGKPNVAGAYTLKITAKNAAGASTTQTVVINVAGLPKPAYGTFNGLVARDLTLSAPVTTAPGQKLWGHGGSLSNLVITSSGVFTGTLYVEDKKYSMPSGSRLNAVVGEDPTASVVIKRGTGIANLQLAFSINRTTGELTGTLTDGTVVTPVALRAWRNPWKTTITPDSAANPATALAATYTAKLDFADPSLEGNAAYPQGNGFGTLKVTAAGLATWTGTLADGTAVTYSTTVGPNGEVPLFSLLYTPTVAATAGSARGWIKVSPGANPAIPDDNLLDTMLDLTQVAMKDQPLFDWSKKAQSPGSTTRSYKAGIPLHKLKVIGGAYVKPVAGSRVLGLANTTNNAKLTFASAGLENAFTYLNVANGGPSASLEGKLFTITSTNTVTMPAPTANPATLALTLNATTGVLSGSFVLKGDPDPTDHDGSATLLSRTVKFFGLLVPRGDVRQGVGRFLLPQLPADATSMSPKTTLSTSPILSGQVLLEPAL